MNIKKSLVLLSFFVIIIMFMGAVSAESMNLTETELASSGVKNYTESNNHLPGYVHISDKNSTTPSFLNTVTKFTVELNQGVTTPVDIDTVGNPTGPSGSGTGTVYKTEYVDIASRVSNFIDNNGVAPNYASSSKGNIRYESLVYMYAKILNYYLINGQLPNYVTVVYYSGTDSTGVVIDNVPPTVTNNLPSGTYDTLKNVTLTANDSIDPNPNVYYSLDNGVTWNNQVKTVTLNLNPGSTLLKYYGRDASGNVGTTQTATYTINAAAPPSTTITDLLYASYSVQTYIEANHELPDNMTIFGTTVNMSQFLYLTITAVANLNNNITTSISIGNFERPLNSSETISTTGNLTKTDYISLASSVKSYMDSNGRAPDYRSINLGNMGYESLVYTFAEILKSYKAANVLPNFITVIPWSVVANNGTMFITMDQIRDTADMVQSYIETNHQLPEHVTISKSTVSMPNFLKLEVLYLINAKDNLFQSIVLKNYNTAPNPYESITGGDLSVTDYLDATTAISNFMDTNGYAPNYKTTVRGYIRYESLVYMYAQIINSASTNLWLPSYITLTPWATVTDQNTIFLTMDQIKTAASTVKFYIEINHALPASVTISGMQITMPQFLNLELKALKNVNAGLYQSIVLQSYNTAPSPSETLTSGKINYENYLVVADNIISFMYSNGYAPNYAGTSQGNMRYEDLVFMYSQILNYYNVKNTIPQYVTVIPWSVISNPNTVTFNVDQVISGSETVKTYIETNHALPNNVNISGTIVSMPQFLKLLTTSLHCINGTYAGQLVLQSYGLPTDTPETVTGGSLNQTQYLDLARSIEFFMYGDGRAPNYQTSSLGNINYPSLIYMYSQILSSYKANNYTLPDLITVRSWSVVSNVNTKFITTDQIKDASETVKSYTEANHTLPSYVTISGTQVTMPQFLKLLTTTVTNINGKLNAKLVLQSYNTANSPSETVTGGNINTTSFIDHAETIISYMDSNGRAPDYVSTSLGNIRYESLVYLYSLIVDYYGNKTALPQKITVTPWAVVSDASTIFFTVDQIQDASKTLQSYVETNHQLPSSVTIAGTTVNMAQFLQMAVATVLNIDDSLYTSIALISYDTALTPSETITKGENIVCENYVNLANDIMSYMHTNGQAPNCRTTSLGDIRFESLIYMYSQIINSHDATNTLPQFITVNPWMVISNTSTVFITTDQIKNASETVKSYVDTNYTLPNTVTVAGIQVTTSQFLNLLVRSVINIENYLNTSIILETIGNPTNITEKITCGTIYNTEFVSMANKIKSYMDTNGTAPNNVTDTTIGDVMGYESLVYMYSKIVTSYNATETPPEKVYVVPWIARSNPNGTFNFRTYEIFNSIQEAIDDQDTIIGDTIWLQKTNYSENVVVNKKVTIRPIYDCNVTIQALNPNLPIFTINISANGTTIQDLIINGSINNVGIFINNSNENQILGNNITNNTNGIYVYNSTNNVISGNEISNNGLNGVFINTGSENEVSSNSIFANDSVGIKIQDSNNSRIYSNNLYNNLDGIYLNNSSTEVHFNRILGNSRYGFYNVGNGTINATNNWWGSNSPLVSLNSPSDICISGGEVIYDPWLVLSVNSLTDRSDRNGTNYNYQITADITHNNQGKDTSSDGSIPDNIPIYFNTTIGTMNSSGTTKRGRSELKLTGTSAGLANVSVTLDNQTVSQSVNITSINILGVRNDRTMESFSSIQEAIDDPDTVNGDTITISEGLYVENVLVDKKIIIKAVTGENVTLKPQDFNKSVILVVNAGSGTEIRGINIVSANISHGISLSNAYNCLIIDNIISESEWNVYLYMSGNNNITGNIIKSGVNGISLYKSTGNNILYNNIIKNENGLYAKMSNYNSIIGNKFDENYYGVYIQHSNNFNTTGNNLTVNWVGIYLYDTNDNKIIGNNLTDNGAGITYHDSIGTIISENNFADNWLTDTSVIESGEVIMATTMYTCGPAALATILKKLGIYTTEAEMAKIAETDETGTSLLGLKNAANAKGVNAYGYELSIGQLQPDYIVVLKINGYNHFDVIQNITNDTVTLFDPNLGIIQMNLTKFNELYMGYAFVLNDAIQGAVQLTDDQMGTIKGLWHTVRTMKWRWHPPEKRSYTIRIDRKIPYYVPVFSYYPGWKIWTPWGYKRIGAFWYLSGFERRFYHLKVTRTIYYYVPGYWEPYAVYTREPDPSDINKISYYGTLFTVTGAGLTLGAVSKSVTLIRAGVSVYTAVSTQTLFSVGDTILSLYGAFSYTNPDPNPIPPGEEDHPRPGEPYVNCIDPSWEPYLAN
ncbi:MAG: right-handed parallel beta-helix repeat-containing protein [Methanobacterium sp.]|nr:right-handed parallel beta-helix repeat-containing protein [Methanobacterium sp.]